MTTTDSPRPEPLKALIGEASTINGLMMGVLTALVSAGLITVQTSNLVTALFGLIPGALAVAATVLGARALAVAGRAEVTPVSDPMDDEGQRLVPRPTIPPVTYTTTTGGPIGPLR